MLRHILFCVGCFWLEINCAFKILFGECFGKETRKEKKKKKKKGKASLESGPAFPSSLFAFGPVALSSAQLAAQWPRHTRARPFPFPSLADSWALPLLSLSLTDDRGPRVSASPSPSSSPSRTRFHAELDPRKFAISLPFSRKLTPINPLGQPRGLLFAFGSPKPSPRALLRAFWILPRATPSHRHDPTSLSSLGPSQGSR